MVKQIIETTFNKKTFYILLTFLLIGTLIFVGRELESDFYLIVQYVLANPYFLCLFLFPFVIIVYLFLYQNVSRLTPLLTRLSRDQYVKLLTKLSFIYTIYISVIALLILFIMINLLENVDYSIKLVEGIHKLGSYYNIFIAFISITKVIMSIFVYLLIINFILLVSRKETSIFYIVLIDIVIFASKSLNFKTAFFNWLLPANNIYSYIYGFNIYINLFLNIIYFLIIGIIIYKVLKHFIKKKDIKEVDIC